MADKYGELKLVDPVNFISQQINYVNSTYYTNNTPSEEIAVFVSSFFLKVAEIMSVELHELGVKIYPDKTYPVFCNLTEGGISVAEVRVRLGSNRIKITKK